jgi:hypothetical protein
MGITHRPIPALLAVWAGLTIGLLAGSQPAMAAGKWKFESTFGKEGLGNGEFQTPTNAAVQQSTGDLFIADQGNMRVQIFDPKGKYLAQIDGTEAPRPPGGFGEIASVAVAPSGDVYVVDHTQRVVDKFKPKGATPEAGYEYLCRLTGPEVGCVEEGTPEFIEPSTVAVDAGGNVYVGQGGGGGGPVEEFDAEGNYLAALGPSIPFTSDVAVNASGSAVYVADLKGGVTKLSVQPNSHKFLGENVLAKESEEALAVAVDQSTGNVFVDSSRSVGGGVKEYEEEATGRPGEEPLELFGSKKSEIGEESLGIAYSSHGGGAVYVTGLGNHVHIFVPETAGSRPEVTCTAPGSLGAREATLNCTIEPKEGEPALWHFEYKEAGTATWTKTTGGEVTSAGEVKETIVGLKPETRYIYRVVASGVTLKKEITSAQVGFRTTIAVGQCKASGITGESATLQASLAPSVKTDYEFEYIDDLAYAAAVQAHDPNPYAEGARTPQPPGQLPGGSGEVTPTAAAGGLEPNTAYDCRLVATEEGQAPTAGANGTFKTPLVAPTVNDKSPTASVTRKTATLTGTINPENSGTKYHFVYVEAARYAPGGPNPYAAGGSTESASAGSGFGDETVQSQVGGLTAGTTYDYALVASNEADETSPVVGQNHEFITASLTPPIVGLAEVTGVTQTAATVLDTVDPAGLPTNYEFALGEEEGSGGEVRYNYSHPTTFGQVVPGHEAIEVHLEGLAPGTTYHYRILATNEDGPGSVELTFTTPAVASPIAQPIALALLPIPAIAFPTEPGSVVTKTKTKTLTRAQKLANALKACTKKPRRQRAACVAQAHRKYGKVKAKKQGKGK